MALTPSTMLPLGTVAPSFSLPDPTGTVHELGPGDAAAVTVVAFICNHCPYVKHLKAELAELGNSVVARGGAFYAINSNDFAAHPSDAPEAMQQDVAQFGYRFPYLVDEDQSVAKAYQAACTPDFYVFGSDHRLIYRGQFDDSRPGNHKPITGADLSAAIDAAFAGEPASLDQTPSVGCNIKWKRGNEPGGRGWL